MSALAIRRDPVSRPNRRHHGGLDRGNAAIAAGMEGGTNSVAMAQAVAAQDGFVNGSGNVTVTVSFSASATGCTSNCYSVSQAPAFHDRPARPVREAAT